MHAAHTHRNIEEDKRRGSKQPGLYMVKEVSLMKVEGTSAIGYLVSRKTHIKGNFEKLPLRYTPDFVLIFVLCLCFSVDLSLYLSRTCH